MDTELPIISIVMPCRNEEYYIINILKNLHEQDGVNKKFCYEVFIVEGLSSDNTKNLICEYIKDKPNFKLIINEKKITPVAFNLGIMAAKGSYICILGSHAEIEKDYLLSCLNTIIKTGADNVGGPWIAKSNSYMGKAISIAFQSPISVGGAKSHNIDYEGLADSVWGGFYKRSVFENIGLFDEELVRNQDDELNYRLIKNNGKIWQTPKIKYQYISRDSLKKLFNQYFQYGYWKIRVIQKHKIPSSIRHLIPGLFITVLAILTGLSFISTKCAYLLFSLLAFYLAIILTFSFISCKKRPIYIPAVFAAIIVFHFSYGFGFLKGIFDFVIVKKQNKSKINDYKLSR